MTSGDNRWLMPRFDLSRCSRRDGGAIVESMSEAITPTDQDDPTPRTAAASRVWFITGASRGLGRAFTEAALAAGDRVVGAARDVSPLDGLAARHPGRLLALPLDVTDRAAVVDVVARAVGHFGRLDIVVNNAGALFAGMIEEFTEAEARAQLELNFFGALWVSQAVLPQLRAQSSGHIVQISSIGALGGFPSTGLYSASKFALEGMSEALAAEAAQFGAKVTIVQPGGYWTDLYTSSTATSPNPAYDSLREELARQWADGSVDSEPRLAAEALMKLVDSDDPPLRLLLGSMVYDLAFDISRRRMETWAGWEQVSRAAEKAVPAPATEPA
jgi:NAD(P)-dependent dehydrogenase (short-subunit alcohol dehydrogenase family)